MDISQMIKTARENKNFTQTQVADKMDIGLRMYQKIEAGNFPKFKTEQIRKLDSILKTNFYELIYEQKDSSKIETLIHKWFGFKRNGESGYSELEDGLIKLLNEIEIATGMSVEDISKKAYSSYLNSKDKELVINEHLSNGILHKNMELHLRKVFRNELAKAKEKETVELRNSKTIRDFDSQFLVSILTLKARMDYAKSTHPKAFLDELEKYPIALGVDTAGAEWMYFEIGEDCMEPIFNKDEYLLASKVHKEDWQSIRNTHVYVVVTNEDVMIKRIHKKNESQFVLISDNESCQQTLIDLSAIKELWFFRRHIASRALPPKEIKIKI